jgi:hypothetical protein
MKRITLATLLVSAAIFGATQSVGSIEAHAQQPQSVSITVRVIVANHSGTTDGALAALSTRLQAQFPEFSGFSQHSSTTVQLGVAEEQRISVPGGGQAVVRHLGMEGSQNRFEVSLPGGSTQVRMPAASVFFVGGAAVETGTLILMLDT